MSIIYKGQKFEIEFLENESGKCEGEEFYRSLDDSTRKSFLFLFKALGDLGQIKNKTKFNFEGSQLFAFKHDQVRFTCFFANKKVIITHGFYKKQDKIPANEKSKALKLKKLYDKS
jgi:hypothetical protein